MVMAAHSARAAAKMLGLVVAVGLAILGVGGSSTSTPGGADYYVPLLVSGDSYTDGGNNNYLATTVRADSPPYGIDSPTGRPTGRFSNYRNFVDFISQVLGLPEPPSPYLSPRLSGQRLLYGANFASGGAGILNDTSLQQGNVISLTEQMQSFQRYQSQLSSVAGGREQARRLINQALFLIAIGTYDFLDNFFRHPFSARGTQYTLSEFIDYLISEYTKYVQGLYRLGARRVLVIGVGNLGCLPAVLAARSDNGQCDAQLENAALMFNDELIAMGQRINREFGSNIVIVANTNRITEYFFSNAAAYGFTETRVACCGQGPYNGAGQCTPASNLCPNRDEYVFWDAIHLTDRANSKLVELILNGGSEIISPMNLNTMLAMNNGA